MTSCSPPSAARARSSTTERLRVAARKRLADAVVALRRCRITGAAISRCSGSELAAIQDKVAGLRRFGAAALDLAWVAAGRFDGYWERGLSPWDFAAGSLIVREAGGFVTDLDGNEAHMVAGRRRCRQRNHARGSCWSCFKAADGQTSGRRLNAACHRWLSPLLAPSLRCDLPTCDLL